MIRKSVAEIPRSSRDLRIGSDRPHVPQRLRAFAADGRRGRGLHAATPGSACHIDRDGHAAHKRFVEAMERFAETAGVDLVRFEKDRRKDDVAQQYLAAFTGDEGVLFIGKAQEKASVFRTEKRRNTDGSTYPWMIRSTVPVNHYYVYLFDRDFGPLFIKFCSYFPYAVKVCLNGHEWLKRQLTQRGLPYEPLDNGIRSSDDATRVQRIANTLDAAKIDAVVRKWLR